MKIETMLNKANRYFVDKILNGEFEVKHFSEHTVNLLIDKKYFFVIWMSNGWDCVNTYQNEKQTMKLEFSQSEQKAIYEKLFPYKDNGDKAKEREERTEYERLKQKFENEI